MGWLDTIGGYPRDDSDELMKREAYEKRQCGDCDWFNWDDYNDRDDGLGKCMRPVTKFITVCPDWDVCEYFVEAE